VKKTLAFLAAFALVSLPMPAQEREKDRLEECGQVLKEILHIPDNIPQDLLDKAECVVVFPAVKKAAFGIGASYGRGAIVCRGGEKFTGPWGAPAMFRLIGGNIGFQIGGEATDYVLLVMNPRGANSILNTKVKLGADASVADETPGNVAMRSVIAAILSACLRSAVPRPSPGASRHPLPQVYSLGTS